jgi:hypothetical protein
MLPFSYHLSLSHCSSCFHSILLLESLEQLVAATSPFGNRERLWRNLGVQDCVLVFHSYEVIGFFEYFCGILSSLLGKLVYLARFSNSVVAGLNVLYLLMI